MKKSFRVQLLTSSLLIGSAAIATPSFAQVATPSEARSNVEQTAEADQGSDIVVTGSRIANPNLEQSSPVVSIGSEEIARQAPTSVENFLRELPGTVAGTNENLNNGANGTATFNLRGLGSNRNLVLLNSPRVVLSGLTNVTDLNNIPISLIQRVDVFTGGAVTAYGADAISGVVNFITKQDFSGVDLTVQQGISGRGDGAKTRLDLVTGANFDGGRGNVTFAVNYTKVNPVLQGDRDYSFLSRQSTCSAAAGQTTTGAAPTACDLATIGIQQGSNTAVPASLFFPLPAGSAFSAAGGGRFDPATGTIVPGLSDYNFSPLNLFQTPLERYSLFGQAHYKVTDGIEVYSEGFYSRNKVRVEVAPTGTFTNALQIPLNNQFLTAAQRTQLCSFAQQSGAGITNCPNAIAAGTEITAIVARRFVETGAHVTTFNSNAFQITAGIRGKITDTLKFDIFGQHCEADRPNTATGGSLADRVQQGLRNCPTGSTPGCVPINIFGDNGSITPAALAFISTPTSTFVETQFTTAQAILNGDFGVGSPFAKNPIGIAVGAE